MGVNPLLEFAAVRFAYRASPVAALDELSFSLQAGDGIALLGANGAGKTTALRLAMALLHPVAGEVRVAGLATTGRMPEDLAGRAGYLFQQPEHQLFASTVREDVAFGPRRLGAADADHAVAEALDLLELRTEEAVHPYDLPAPRRRLVALAGVLALRPQLLLLDEPTAGMDRQARRLVRRAVARHRAAAGAALAVSHDGEFVLESLDRALVLEHGCLAHDLDTASALGLPGAPARPAAAEIAARLGAPAHEWRFEPAVAFVAARCRARREA